MIIIDRNDSLYKYLTALGVENIDGVYLELAKNGRFKLDDVRTYFGAIFTPSQTTDIDDKELEKVLDYYVDLKKIKHLNSKTLREKLKEYKKTNSQKLKEEIVNSELKDVLYLCLNYKTLHNDCDLQDLVQIANMGLLKALEKYDEKAKLDLKDYIIYYIRENIKEFEEKTNG